MERHHWGGIAVILLIFAILSLGGIKNAGLPRLSYNKDQTPEQKLESQIREVDKLIQAEKRKETESEYKDIVTLSQVNRSTDPMREYALIKVSNSAKNPILVTGWKLQSKTSGMSVNVPKGTYLFFTSTLNSEENVYLSAGDMMYLITGYSPNGISFKLNKCSGYLEQFQNFIPPLPNNCPYPRDEDLSKIANITANDDCLDYIESFPNCRTQTGLLPVTWTYECKNFIETKLNYSSCVNTHKPDSDFYQHEWRIYLRRSASIWKSRRENIILYDNLGKIVDTLEY